jgi:DNA-binding NarL/FixJ family response regulator
MTDRGAGDTIRILFVEDHTALREGTRALLATTRDLVIVSEASAAGEAVFLTEQLRPDGVLLDLRLAEESSGFDVARHILRTLPNTAILVLTAVEDPEYARAAMRLGIRGYLLKTARVAAVAAIRQVNAGQLVLDPAIAGPLDALRERPAGGRPHGTGAAHPPFAGPRRMQSADRRHPGPDGRMQVARLPKKLGLPSRAALVAYAAREAATAENAPLPDVLRSDTLSPIWR